MISLLLVDDQPAVRRGLQMRLALEPDMQVVGEAGDAQTALALAQALQPTVVLLDVELPHADGILAVQQLHAVAPQSAVVILTLHDDEATRSRARAAGVAAFVAKQEPDTTLLDAIRAAARAAG